MTATLTRNHLTYKNENDAKFATCIATPIGDLILNHPVSKPNRSMWNGFCKAKMGATLATPFAPFTWRVYDSLFQILVE